MVAPWAKRQPDTPPYYTFVEGRNAANRRDDLTPLQPPSHLFPRESLHSPTPINRTFLTQPFPSYPWGSPRPARVSPIETTEEPESTFTTTSFTDDYFERINNMINRIDNDRSRTHSFRQSVGRNIVRPPRSPPPIPRRLPRLRSYETDDNIGDNNSTNNNSDDDSFEI